LGSELYPDLLASIPAPPAELQVRGSLPLSGLGLAIVGSRRPTLYGLRTARELAAACAGFGIPVVSGLARGIDAAAHAACLKAGGITWAVLGSGLDWVYPPEHAELARDIAASGGAVLSEFAAGTPPQAGNFPRRNRIISGLALGVVVVEGDLKSGALITAKAALEQGREVFAVPGPVDSPMSEGPHELLRQGACLLRRLEDALEALPQLGGAEGSEEQGKIIELLGPHALSLDDLAGATGWGTPRLLRALGELELRDRVRTLPGQRYARNH
jgi:DNA processing protein